MTAIAKRKTNLATLADLVEPINVEHRAFEAAFVGALDRGRQAGELLLKAKELCPHGIWGDWLTENFEGSDRAARRYMWIVGKWPEIEKLQNGHGVAKIGVNDVVNLLADHRDSEPAEVVEELQDDSELAEDSQDDQVTSTDADVDADPAEADEIDEPERENAPVGFDFIRAKEALYSQIIDAIDKFPTPCQPVMVDALHDVIHGWQKKGFHRYVNEHPDASDTPTLTARSVDATIRQILSDGEWHPKWDISVVRASALGRHLVSVRNVENGDLALLLGQWGDCF